MRKKPENNQPPAIRSTNSSGDMTVGFSKLTDALIASRKARMMQNISQTPEMIASHQGRNLGLAKLCVVTTNNSNGLNNRKKCLSK
jgi:hypothetical protein